MTAIMRRITDGDSGTIGEGLTVWLLILPIPLKQCAEEQLSLKGAIISKRAKAKPKIQSMIM